MLEFDVTANALCTNSAFRLHNCKIEKQNKQIKTFQVVLLTRPRMCVCVCVCVCVWRGGVPIPLINCPFVVWGGGGATIRSKNKIEKQNKQIKTFQVVLLTRPGVCLWGWGRGGRGTYSLDNLPVCSMIICFIKMICKACKTFLELD